MVRKVLCLLVMIGVMAVPVRASEQGGRILLEFSYGEGITGGAVRLIPVAEPLEDNYRLRDYLGGGVIRREDAGSPELALWLADRAGEWGEERLLDADGRTEFTDLERGLYLLIQTQAPEGYVCTPPFLIRLPLDGSWEVLARPKTGELRTASPRTGQHPAPVIGAAGMLLSAAGLYLCMEKLRKK